MKKLLTISILALLSACGSKESETTQAGNILENLTYSVDTVLIDPGDDIINLNSGLYNSTLSQDHQKLYKFDETTLQLQEIDLNKLVLAASYPFENEGPNGLTPYKGNMTLASDGYFIFNSYSKIGMFSNTGELMPNFDYTIDKLISGERPERSMLSQFAYMDENQRGFFLETAFNAPVFNLISIDFEAENSKVIDLPNVDRTHDYSVVSNEYGYPMSSIQLVTVQTINSKVYITTPVTSGVYRYDPELDSLEYVTFPLTLTQTEKTKKIKNEVSSADERKEQNALIHSEVGFKQLLWDDQSNRFYRFSSIGIPNTDTEATPKNKVYLSAFDPQLDLIGEKFLEDLTAIPPNAFFKDGKLWSYVNIEDELGFAVFTFDF
ncbi:DUF4221 family protein [Algoriphagus sp. D3-2-R+10]|uniref:DUF4221 family protein n=1 Tax=Algoriphagus aurantiacus TaxID=3103948 RepID=UPI002B3826E3|nr:DUF4221 family protein [Algoriphagus sp. D3-2-R+10]MEB2776592.1 DUF4221 family protein [Algoriphagus sp. D3-2-R+10]